ncbi:MAG: pyridoxamine 5'-phosphate oxidase family protein [Bacteroidota bacterium]
MKPTYTDKQKKSHVNLVLNNAQYCHISMAKNNEPYMVTVNYGYDDEFIYFHSGQKGKKAEIITTNPSICFELNYGAEIITNKQSCNWGTKYRSIIGFGKAQLLETVDDKTKALIAIMRKYSGNNDHEFNEHVLAHTNVYRISLDNVNAKNNHWAWE